MAFHLPQLEQQYKTANVIDLSKQNFLHNYDTLKNLGPGEIFPVIKGNAYGHGLAEIAKVLEERRPPLVAVDSVFEAHAIRKTAKTQPILVMGQVPQTSLVRTSLKRVSYVVQDVTILPDLASTKWRKFNLHLHINTGMQREGIDMSELDECLEYFTKYRHLRLEGVMSHLAEADSADNSVTDRQVEQFDELVERVQAAGLDPEWIHLAQTPGTPKVESRYTNAVRPGVGLYGINPYEENDEKRQTLESLQPVLRLTSHVMKLHDLQKGDKVSYGGTFQADGPMRVAVLPVGYYEGLPRTFSNKAVFRSSQGEHPVVGRVCMNHTVIDVSGSNIKLGDEIEVIGRERSEANSVEAHAKRSGVFIYEILSRLDSSLYRHVED